MVGALAVKEALHAGRVAQQRCRLQKRGLSKLEALQAGGITRRKVAQWRRRCALGPSHAREGLRGEGVA